MKNIWFRNVSLIGLPILNMHLTIRMDKISPANAANCKISVSILLKCLDYHWSITVCTMYKFKVGYPQHVLKVPRNTKKTMVSAGCRYWYRCKILELFREFFCLSYFLLVQKFVVFDSCSTKIDKSQESHGLLVDLTNNLKWIKSPVPRSLNIFED